MNTIKEITDAIVGFRNERDWKQFHNAKDMAAGLAIEACELQELFLWKNGSEVDEVCKAKNKEIRSELADIAWFVFLISHDLGIDLPSAIQNKMQENAAKYPVHVVKGSSKKYNEYPDTKGE